MPIRMFALGFTLMFAAVIGVATINAAYAQAQLPIAPCCSIVNGKYIDKTTGKEVAPSKAVPHVAAPIGPCCAVVNGKYIDLKTGKPAIIPTDQARVSPAPSTGGSKPEAPSSGGAGGGGHGK